MSPNTICTMHTPYTHIQVTHLTFCGRIFKCSILEIVCTKTNCIPELCHNSITFAPFLPKISPHTIHTIYFQEFTSLLPKGIHSNIIFLFQKCDLYDRTAKGRTWLVGVTSKDHPDYTQLIWSSSIKLHSIDSQ